MTPEQRLMPSERTSAGEMAKEDADTYDGYLIPVYLRITKRRT